MANPFNYSTTSHSQNPGNVTTTSNFMGGGPFGGGAGSQLSSLLMSIIRNREKERQQDRLRQPPQMMGDTEERRWARDQRAMMLQERWNALPFPGQGKPMVLNQPWLPASAQPAGGSKDEASKEVLEALLKQQNWAKESMAIDDRRAKEYQAMLDRSNADYAANQQTPAPPPAAPASNTRT